MTHNTLRTLFFRTPLPQPGRNRAQAAGAQASSAIYYNQGSFGGLALNTYLPLRGPSCYFVPTLFVTVCSGGRGVECNRLPQGPAKGHIRISAKGYSRQLGFRCTGFSETQYPLLLMVE